MQARRTLPAEDAREWFEREVVALLPELYAAALRLARDPADAEDLAADALAKAWCARSTLADRGAFRGWIFRILTNTFVSACRARRVRQAHAALVDGEELDFSLFEQLHQPFLLWWGNPEQAFLDRLLREDVERAVDALPDAYRTVVVLVELQGLSYQEAAEALEVPVGTVRSRLARGRARLQRELWDHARDAGLVSPPTTPERTGA